MSNNLGRLPPRSHNSRCSAVYVPALREWNWIITGEFGLGRHDERRGMHGEDRFPVPLDPYDFDASVHADLLETTISLVSSSVMGDPANTSPKSTRVSETSI